MTTSTERLAQEIQALRKRVDRRVPQLTRSSLDAGTIQITDGNGSTTGTIGSNFDGSAGVNVTNGPVPPQPTAPGVVAVVGGLRVAWDGNFEVAGTVATLDWSRVDIEVSTNSAFPEYDNLRYPNQGSIVSPAGGFVKVGWPVAGEQVYVRLVSKSLAGKRSTPSIVVGPVATGMVGLGDLGFDINDYAGGTTVFYGTVTPTAGGIGDLWLKQISAGPPPKYETWRWDGASWIKLTDQGVTDALAAAVAAQAAADTKARIFNQASAPAWSGADGSAIWFDSINGNKPMKWNGSAFVAMTLGNGAIQPNSLVASNVVATGTVTAALMESIMVIASILRAGAVTGPHVDISSVGMKAFDLDPDGDVNEVMSLGTGADGIALIDPTTHKTMVQLARDGSISGSGISADSITYHGDEIDDLLTPLPTGLISHTQGIYDDTTGVIKGSITGATGIGEVAFTARQGRTYMIVVAGMHFSSTVAGDRVLVALRGTTGNATPTTTTGQVLHSKFHVLDNATQGLSIPDMVLIREWSSTVDTDVRLLLTAQRFSGTGTITCRSYTISDDYFAPLRWSVIDLGPRGEDSFVVNDGGGDTSTGGTAPTTATKKTYWAKWNAIWTASWTSGGTKRTDADMYQGTYPASGTSLRALANFGGGADTASASGEVGKSIVTALTGATVTSVKVRLHCNHAYSYAGGTAEIGWHGIVTEPSGLPTATLNQLPEHFDRNETIWVTLPSSTYAGLKSGSIRGVTVGPGDSANYMRFDGDSGTIPVLYIAYSR